MKDSTGRSITAEEAHWTALMEGHRCTGCNSPKPTTRFQVFRPVDDLPPGLREQVKLEIKLRIMQPIYTTDGKAAIRISEVFACYHCVKNCERSAAHSPNSRDIVTIDRPPRAARPLVVVA